jgi:two-component system cell cycle sensor histidine kinase/response regulator CckA
MQNEPFFHPDPAGLAPPAGKQEGELRYRSLFENSPIAICEEDFSAVRKYLERLRADGLTDLAAYFATHPEDLERCARMVRIREVNASALQLFDAGSSEELLNYLSTTFEAGYQAQFKLELLAIIRGERLLDCEVSRRTMSGRIIHCRMCWSVEPGDEGGYSKVLVSWLDITEHKQAAHDLEVFAHTVRSVSECVCITDMTDIIWFVNDAFLKTYGFTNEELLGKNISIVRSVNNPVEVTREILPATLRGGWSGEVLNRRKDGSDFPIELSTSLVRDGDRRPIFLVGIAKDISDRKQAEQALRDSEERYRKFFDENLSAVYIARPNGTLLACNPKFLQIFGFDTSEEALGTDLTSLYPDPFGWETAVHLLRKAKRMESQETELRRKDGNSVFVVETMFGVFDSRGELQEIKGYMFDDTRRKKLEDQFRQSQKIEAIGRLAGGIAHDFNNLLTCINGYADLLVSDLGENSPQHKFAEEIRSSGERAAKLTSQLLAFSRHQVLQPESLHINSIIRGMEQMLRRLIGEDIQLIFTLDPSIGSMKADPGQMEQIVMNLAVNARDAMPQGGHLTIQTANLDLDEEAVLELDGVKPGPHVVLAVSDSGCGIRDSDRAHLFEPFFTTKEIGKGTGLGLSTVYGIVKQSEGSIRVTSREGFGTTFSLYFPRLPGGDPDLRKKAISKVVHDPGRETILLVEDEAPVLKLTSHILRMHGYHLLTASDGSSALQIARKFGGTIHLLITDVILPGLGGTDLAKEILKDHPGIKILFMSGYTEESVHSRGGQDLNAAFLSKPFSTQTMIQKVRGLLIS